MGYKDIALVGAFWNCEERAEQLLTDMRPWFDRIAIAVQESPDNTLEVVRSIADVAIPDKWHGHGNISFQKAIDQAKTPWCLLISDDERPSDVLLENLGSIARHAGSKQGFWFHFRSTIEGFEFTREQDNHLRLFRTEWGWPPTIHSRPMIPMEQTEFVHKEKGYITHDRSLDEMMNDYLRRYDIGKGNPDWEKHNIRMMFSACIAIGRLKGVEFVKSFSWWPDVKRLCFVDSTIEQAVSDLNKTLGEP